MGSIKRIRLASNANDLQLWVDFSETRDLLITFRKVPLESRIKYRSKLRAIESKMTIPVSELETELFELILPSLDAKDLGSRDAVRRFREDIISSNNEPVQTSSGYWIFKQMFYLVEGDYSDHQSKLLIMENFDKERRYWEKLERRHLHEETGTSQEGRPRVPEAVRIEVWRRDGGKCARCNSREKLEYDHIIPLSKGGSNTARNIELLCEKCNRSKGSEIA